MSRLIGVALASGLLCCTASARADQSSGSQPKFADYPTAIFRGPKPPLSLDKDDLQFRTRYRGLYTASPNFAGHYSVAVVGCGTDCVFLLTLDLKSGRTAWLNVPSGEELEHCPEDRYRDPKGEMIFHDFYFRPNSRLFVVVGKMPGNECGARYFVERNGEMLQISDVHLKAVQ